MNTDVVESLVTDTSLRRTMGAAETSGGDLTE